jgi:hypothetical protein
MTQLAWALQERQPARCRRYKKRNVFAGLPVAVNIAQRHEFEGFAVVAPASRRLFCGGQMISYRRA